ncbi:MAG: VanZ family protein [Flavobacteriales bacterium]|nr:VanZ family protein [Flavobacteriales bacterium]
MPATWPAVLWGLLILLLTLAPMPETATPGWLQAWHLDKVVHAFLFAVWTVLVVRAIRRVRGGSAMARHAIAIGILLALLYAGLTELFQEHMSLGRRGDLADVAADAAGILAAAAWLKWATAAGRAHHKPPAA